jgi:DsbE subfamily thiol:disulfide oxidoreductase
MKGKTVVLIVVLALALAVIVGVVRLDTNGTGGPKVVAVGFQAPDFHVTKAGGSDDLSSGELKGKVLFINFWASWCDPCKEEMPSVDAVFKEFGSNKDFRMITILYRDSDANGLTYLQSKGFSFPVYIDPDAMSAKNFGVTGVPETYIVDKNGVLRRKMIGPADWTSPEERSLIASLLNQ